MSNIISEIVGIVQGMDGKGDTGAINQLANLLAENSDSPVFVALLEKSFQLVYRQGKARGAEQFKLLASEMIAHSKYLAEVEVRLANQSTRKE